ncbi:MAG: hypothetical protein R6X16_17575, partial [Anaerolineae bacterium]
EGFDRRHDTLPRRATDEVQRPSEPRSLGRLITYLRPNSPGQRIGEELATYDDDMIRFGD